MSKKIKFSKQFIKKIEEQLLKQKQDLENELAAFTNQNPHNKDDYNAAFPELGYSSDENASEVALYSHNLTLERTLEKALRDVKGGLQRIKDRTYGICNYCKEPINEKRLLARPASNSCIECKKKLTMEE